jgi:hypothetical protein
MAHTRDQEQLPDSQAPSAQPDVQTQQAAVPAGIRQRKIARRMAARRGANGVTEDASQHVAAADASSGQPLPHTLQHKYESSLGADLGSVRVHTGAASARAADSVGALAYTIGQDIHFAAGNYQPSSTRGEELLAHEVAHTVQQGAGSIGRQDKLEVSTPGDAFESEADSAAASMVRGEPARVSPATGLARRVIQRAVGFEFEFGTWKSAHDNGTKLDKGEKFIKKTKYNVEGEDATADFSAVEFVFKPLLNMGEVDTHVAEAAALATQMKAKNGEFAAKDVGGLDNYKVTAGEDKAKMQASPSIPLDAVKKFYKSSQLPEPAQRVDNYFSGDDIVGQGQAADARRATRQQNIARLLPVNAAAPSAELKGLLTLLVDYLWQGLSKGGTGIKGEFRADNYPKAAVRVMARTSFTKMLELCPEHAFFADDANRDKWVELVLSVAEAAWPGKNLQQAKQGQVLNMNFAGMENLPADANKGQQYYQATTTREEWLHNMPDKDMLSKSQDKRFEGMGAYGGATDKTTPPPQAQPAQQQPAQQQAPVQQAPVQPPDPLLQQVAVQAATVVGQQVLAHRADQSGALNASAQQLGPAQAQAQPQAQQPQAQAQQPPAPVKEAPIFELRGQGDFLGVGQEVPISSWLSHAQQVMKAVMAATDNVEFHPQGPPTIPADRDSPGSWKATQPPADPAPAPAPTRGQKVGKALKSFFCWPFTCCMTAQT